MLKKSALLNPIYLKFYPTFRCNQNCKFCFVDARVKRKGYHEMNKEEIDRFIKIVQKLKIFRFSILGGEPFLYENLGYILKRLSEADIYTTLTTNGTILDKKMINLMKELNVDLGVALHSSEEEIHDGLVSNRGSFKKVMKFIDYLNKINYSFRAGAVITKKNKGQINSLIKLAAEKGVSSLELIYTLPFGNARKNKCQTSLKEYISLVTNAKKVAKKFNLPLHPDCHYTFFFPDTFYTKDSPLTKVLYGCSIGKTKLDILPNGDISPCSFFMHEEKWLIGNILKDDIKALWRNSPILKHFRERPTPSQCTTRCEFNVVCQGGCPGAHYLEYGSVYCTKPGCPPDPNCKTYKG